MRLTETQATLNRCIQAWLISWIVFFLKPMTAFAQKGLATTPSNDSQDTKLTEGIILAIILGCVAVVVFCICVGCYCCGEPIEYRRNAFHSRLPVPKTRRETLV